MAHAGRWSSSGVWPASGALAVSGSGPYGHGDHDGRVCGPALARLGVRRADARSGTCTCCGTCSGDGGTPGSATGETTGDTASDTGGDTAGGEAVCRAASGLAIARLALTGRTSGTGRTSACAMSSATGAASCGTEAAGRTRTTAFFVFLGRALGGCRCHTRADTTISSFSANGAIRHQVRGSATYRSCELTSSGRRLLSITGLVVSQVRTPGEVRTAIPGCG